MTHPEALPHLPGMASLRGGAATNPLRNKAIVIETAQVAIEVGQEVGQELTPRNPYLKGVTCPT